MDTEAKRETLPIEICVDTMQFRSDMRRVRQSLALSAAIVAGRKATPPAQPKRRQGGAPAHRQRMPRLSPARLKQILKRSRQGH